eukprot:2920209-Pleurochrysis_carterae.AAC.3
MKVERQVVAIEHAQRGQPIASRTESTGPAVHDTRWPCKHLPQLSQLLLARAEHLKLKLRTLLARLDRARDLDVVQVGGLTLRIRPLDLARDGRRLSQFRLFACDTHLDQRRALLLLLPLLQIGQPYCFGHGVLLRGEVHAERARAHVLLLLRLLAQLSDPQPLSLLLLRAPLQLRRKLELPPFHVRTLHQLSMLNLPVLVPFALRLAQTLSQRSHALLYLLLFTRSINRLTHRKVLLHRQPFRKHLLHLTKRMRGGDGTRAKRARLRDGLLACRVKVPLLTFGNRLSS